MKPGNKKSPKFQAMSFPLNKRDSILFKIRAVCNNIVLRITTSLTIAPIFLICLSKLLETAPNAPISARIITKFLMSYNFHISLDRGWYFLISYFAFLTFHPRNPWYFSIYYLFHFFIFLDDYNICQPPLYDLVVRHVKIAKYFVMFAFYYSPGLYPYHSSAVYRFDLPHKSQRSYVSTSSCFFYIRVVRAYLTHIQYGLYFFSFLRVELTLWRINVLPSHCG